MTERSRNIAVGLTAIVALCGLAVIVVLFGYVPDLLERGYVVTVQMKDASGLTEGSRVRLSGIDIGRVTRVALRPLPEPGVRAMLMIREDVRIPAAAAVAIDAPMLGGSPSISFDVSSVPPQRMADLLPTDGSAMVQAQASSLAGEFASEIQKAISGPANRFDKLAEQLEVLSKEWVAVARNINKMVEERDLAAVDAGQATANVTTVLVRADQRLREMQATVDGLNKLINDPQLHADIKATAASAAKATEKIDAAVGQVQQVVTDAGRNVDTLTKRYVAVGDDLSAAIGSLRQTIDAARTGDGTVARLLNDPSLYNNLNDAAQRLGPMIDELRLLLEKWKKEGMKVNL